MRHVPYFLGFSIGIVALGCSSSTTDTTSITRPELVAVSPDDFLGERRCVDGDVLSYVATLFDVTPGSDGSVPDPGLQLLSSPPTSCLLSVTFSKVTTDHRYLAQVDTYASAAQSELGDAGFPFLDAGSPYIVPSAPGARPQLDQAGARVNPIATKTCGDYPPTFVDGGSYGSYGGGASALSYGEAGAAGAADALQSLRAYAGITRTAHDCRPGPTYTP